MQRSDEVEQVFLKRTAQIVVALLGLMLAFFIAITPLSANATDSLEGSEDLVETEGIADDAEDAGLEDSSSDDSSGGGEVGVQSVVDEPADDESTGDDPVVDDPVVEEQVVDDSVVEDSASEDQPAEEPDTNEAPVEESGGDVTPLVEVDETNGENGVVGDPIDKVGICHATASKTNPYTFITPDVDSTINPPVKGHDGHDGPVYNGETGWGDIIPPFYYVDNQTQTTEYYAGQNWSAEGQAIYYNDCVVPMETETPPPTETETPPPTETETPPPGDPVDKIGICHATASTTNPYVFITPDVDSTINPPVKGHDGHDGPVYDGMMESGWGDIIPPFYYVDNQTEMTEYYEGQNWTEEGQAIYYNDCVVPMETETPPPTETETPPPTETETIPPTETETHPPVDTKTPEPSKAETPKTSAPSTPVPAQAEVTPTTQDSDGLAQTGETISFNVIAAALVLMLAGTVTLLAARRGRVE